MAAHVYNYVHHYSHESKNVPIDIQIHRPTTITLHCRTSFSDVNRYSHGLYITRFRDSSLTISSLHTTNNKQTNKQTTEGCTDLPSPDVGCEEIHHFNSCH